MTYYYNKYLKYKYKNDIIECSYPYFSHQTSCLKSFEDILQNGFIIKGSEVSEKDRRLSGGKPKEYIYCTIHYDDSIIIPPISFIINNNILNYNTMYFNVGWYGNPNKNSIIIKKSDSYDIKQIFLNRLQKIIKNNLHPTDYNVYGWMGHEILFDENININMCVDAVVCTNEIAPQIFNLLKKYNYAHLKLVIK